MQIQANERDKIALLKAKGNSINQIARLLARSKSTISEEIKRNSFKGNYFV